MTNHATPTSTNHGGLIFPLEMFRASALASAIAEGLLAKIKNIVDAQLILTRHATGPLVLVQIDGAVMGEDAAEFWEENMDLALYASQALPRECFAYYLAEEPARKQGLLIAQRGQVVAGDQATEDTIPPEAGADEWPLPRLCQQLGVTNTQSGRQRHALLIAVIANTLVQQLIGNGRGEFMAVLNGDKVEHQIQSGGSTGTGIALAVDLEDFCRHFDVWKQLGKGGQVLPVDRAGVAVEQAGFGEDKGTRADRPNFQPFRRGFAQKWNDYRGIDPVHIQP